MKKLFLEKNPKNQTKRRGKKKEGNASERKRREQTSDAELKKTYRSSDLKSDLSRAKMYFSK